MLYKCVTYSYMPPCLERARALQICAKVFLEGIRGDKSRFVAFVAELAQEPSNHFVGPAGFLQSRQDIGSFNDAVPDLS